MLPYVVFLDIDRTMIRGYARACCDRYWLRRVVRDLVDPGELASPGEAALSLGTVLGPELVRPGLGPALRRIRAALGGRVEFFVCSMGTRAVVHDCKLPGIEAATGIRFARPVFCNSSDPAENSKSAASAGKKLVAACFRRAVASLARRYPALAEPGADRQVFEQRFLMVDDTEGVAFDTASNERLLVCPAFDDRGGAEEEEGEDDPLLLLHGLPDEVRSNEKVLEYMRSSCGRRPAPAGCSHRAPPKRAREDSFWSGLADLVERAAEGARRRQQQQQQQRDVVLTPAVIQEWQRVLRPLAECE